LEHAAVSRNDDVSFRALRMRVSRGGLLRCRWLMVGTLGFCAGVAAPWTIGQGGPSIKASAMADPLAGPPRSWAVDAVANELIALHHPNSYLRYRMHVVDSKGDQVRDVIESKDGSVARLILKDGRPLTEEEDKAERQRLDAMIASPSDYAKHIKDDSSGRKMADELMRLMPDAMTFTYTPGQPQTGTNGGGQEVVLDYKPNPKFSPPTTASQALTGLEGRAWIDVKSHQLVHMDGTIFRGINFGWGVLAHIYPGGQLALEQANVGGSRWIFTHFEEKVSARALMVKTINIHTKVDAGSFQTLGPMGYQDAIHILLNTPLPSRR
jgi:hypothetical protein